MLIWIGLAVLVFALCNIPARLREERHGLDPKLDARIAAEARRRH